MRSAKLPGFLTAPWKNGNLIVCLYRGNVLLTPMLFTRYFNSIREKQRRDLNYAIFGEGLPVSSMSSGKLSSRKLKSEARDEDMLYMWVVSLDRFGERKYSLKRIVQHLAPLDIESGADQVLLIERDAVTVLDNRKGRLGRIQVRPLTWGKRRTP